MTPLHQWRLVEAREVRRRNVLGAQCDRCHERLAPGRQVWLRQSGEVACCKRCATAVEALKNTATAHQRSS